MKSHTVFILSLWTASSLFALPSSNNSTLDRPIVSKGDGPNFYVDYSNFRGLDKETFVEFYVQVSYDELQFFKHLDRFRAGYDLTLDVLDTNGQVLEKHQNRDVFEVGTYLETQSVQKARVSLVGYTLPPGRYTLRAQLTDIETRHSTNIEETFRAEDFSSPNLMMSDIQFSHNITPAEDGQPYVKNQRYIEPNAVRNFAHGMTEYFYVYFEVYNLKTKYHEKNEGTYQVQFIFGDSEGQRIAQLKRPTEKPGATSAHSLRFRLDHFEAGDYTLTVRITDKATGFTSENSNSFSVLDLPFSVSEADFRTPNH
ncbi:hypothetical protein GWO43_26795 [candidate division KSB1 bacterium]|nr:hypothetical protein [candidate division KSB1 bacterium]NIR70169.1 hypothetical protein [candidate division KSB1 bacterium]NIS27555.1 hypothetical protein [candidate division KSB1 bacterium]NIT74408.1 hypothetical protein [candidate division KSB1 bacterium]NIU28273.1 hypothetical protein [candidate division KSB1 bacterium]